MKSLKRWLYSAVLLATDALSIYASFKVAYHIRFHYAPFLAVFPAAKGMPPWNLYQQALRVVLPLWILIFGLWSRIYRGRFLDAADEFMAIAKGVSLGTLLIIAATFLYREYEYSRLVMALGFIISILLIFAARELIKSLFHFIFEAVIPREMVVLLGEGKSMDALFQRLEKEPHTRTVLFGARDLQDLKEKIRSEKYLKEIYVSGQWISNPQVLDLIDDCEDRGIEVKVLPDILEMRMGEITVDDSLRIPILHLKPLSLHGFGFFVKRVFDVTVSVLLVSVFFFPFLILSLLIVLDSPGGIFFIQDRIGFKEKKFKCFKFRTMHADAEKKLEGMNLPSFRGGPAFKMKGDPRITRVGKWIRKFSGDECAQIWNVLKGEMSLIGPRPQVLAEAQGNPAWAKKRYRILPGITGLWQVSGRADLSYEEMMRLDIYYLENWSPGLDLKILLKTLPVVLWGKGAY